MTSQEVLQRLVWARRQSGLTQAEVARRMGNTNQGDVSRLERGKTDSRLSTICRYASAIGWTLTLRDPEPDP